MFERILLIGLILICLYVAYGAFFKDWGGKHYIVTRGLPEFFKFSMPRDVKNYRRVYKGLILFTLIILIGLLVFDIVVSR